MRAELKGIIEGMKLAWDKGIRKLRIQSDSKVAVDLLCSGMADLIHHIYREANFAADFLANLGHSYDLGIHVVEFSDVTLQYWLNFDLLGIYTLRFISNNT
ncbi:Putative ribonuclease H protein At1g65750 [Linum perenne]